MYIISSLIALNCNMLKQADLFVLSSTLIGSSRLHVYFAMRFKFKIIYISNPFYCKLELYYQHGKMYILFYQLNLCLDVPNFMYGRNSVYCNGNCKLNCNWSFIVTDLGCNILLRIDYKNFKNYSILKFVERVFCVFSLNFCFHWS